MVRIAAVGIAALTLALVVLLAWGAWRGGDDASIDDLPTVEEVVAAQAHRHGVDLPEVSDEDRVRLTAPPTSVSSLSPYEQVLGQLLAVREAAGVDEAVAILGEVALQSDVVARECPRIYAALTQGQPAAVPVAAACPG